MERIVSEFEILNEIEVQRNLRPRTFQEYIGQESLKEKIFISIQAAKRRGTVIDHVLLYGPPGLGKLLWQE